MVESGGTSPRMDMREVRAHDWLLEQCGNIGHDWRPIAGDASCRRYFRVTVDDTSRVVMDAPPEKLDSAPFVDICARLRKAGLHAPEILACSLSSGYMLLEDLGDSLYRDLITRATVQPLFEEAFEALAVMATEVDCSGLPPYDADTLHDELNLFTDLFLLRHLGYRLKHAQKKIWSTFCDELVTDMLNQPQVFVHRDVHSCNLLQTEFNSPGIIDFQDGVAGPLCHDFVSLIWDRYIAWPRDMLEGWMDQFRRRLAVDVDPEQWIRWCDMTGLQRNIRIVGRFAQLKYEEDKPGYIAMIPRFHRYVTEVLRRYPRFSAVTEWIGSNECAP